jgi:hypothetical protein
MAYGKIPGLFAKIREASPPPKFTRDFVSTGLGFTASSDRAFPPFLKRLGFVDSANIPTQDYKDYRGEEPLAKSIMARRIKASYPHIFQANEYAWKLDKSKLADTVKRVEGLSEGSGALDAIVGTFMALCTLTDFSAEAPKRPEEAKKELQAPTKEGTPSLGLSYTIALNLPPTTDIEVFNAIFKSLKENILHE